MDYTIMNQYWIWLSSVPGITPRKFYSLLTAAGDARAVWDNPASVKQLLDEKTYASLVKSRSEQVFYKIFTQMEKLGAVAVTRIDTLYPERLASIIDAPPTLYVMGLSDLGDERMFAIVGTRTPSYDGKKAAREFAQTLAENGVSVISGLARGIDTCAHEACVLAEKRTVAVLGSGLNRMYPPENAGLARRIIELGGSIVSEMQLDEEPSKWSFPARNRIIAGLSTGVLVVEGRGNSGALITADLASEQGKDVYAVPGSIYAPMSEGPNNLIQNGAYAALNPWDIMESQRWGTRKAEKSARKTAPEMSEDEQKLYDILKIEALSFDEIAYRTGFSTSSLNSCLTMMTLRGIIVKAPGNYYRAS